MNSALKRELFLLSGLASVAAAALGRRKIAGGAGLAALGLFASSLKSQTSLKAKTAIITGGSRGLGLSLAWNLLKLGAKAVTLVARDEGELQNARELLLRDFPTAQIETLVCDVTHREALAEAIDAAISAMGSIDLLINNAGAMMVAPLETLAREEFEAQMALHLYAAIDATSFITPYFKTRGAGRILNICSLGGRAAIPHMLPYATSKFALSGFAQGATAELRPFGIIMTTAYPTVMRTGSPKQAVFKGDHEKEFLWFAGLDNMPGFSLSADAAAKKILEAVCEERSEIILSAVGQLRVVAGAVLPETVNAVMALVSRLLPRGQSEVRKTGQASSVIFDQSPLFSGLKKTSDRAQLTYNQMPGEDADFNLGLKH